MGRFHMCMPVSDGEGFCCALCHRDMNEDLRPYDTEEPASPWEEAADSAADAGDGVLQGGRMRTARRGSWT